MDMQSVDLEEVTQKACTLLKSMANKSRLMILCQLADKEMSVGEILKQVPLSQSALSQHLSMLRRENIVATRREAQSIKYSLASEDARVLIGALYELYCAPSEDDCAMSGAPNDENDEQSVLA